MVIELQQVTGTSYTHHRTRMMRGIREDLAVWNEFLHSCNSLSFWREDLLVDAELQVNFDTAGSSRFGIYFEATGVLKSGLWYGYKKVGSEFLFSWNSSQF